MLQILHRHRLFVVGALIVVAATAVLLFFARDKRFDVGDVAINPAARIDPERTYELVVWEEELIIPWAAKTQSEMLIDAIRQFQGQWPNAAITYTIVDPEESREKLAAAVASGVPPDVYGTAQGVVLYPQMQVPASPYLLTTDDDRPGGLSPVATGMLRMDDTIWGWPRAIWWQTWLGRRKTADGAGETDPWPHWTWDQFVQWAQADAGRGLKSGTPARQTSLALNVLDIVVLEQLMSNAGAPAYIDAAGNLLWNEATLIDVASFLRTLQREGLLPEKAASGARTRLQTLFEDDGIAIGPVGPHLTQAIVRHSPDTFTLLPVPRRETAPPVATMDTSAYFVFRHEAYEGDDHTRLATELAAFLAAYSEGWLVESLGLIPVRDAGRAMWDQSAPLDRASRDLLRTYADQAASPPTMRAGLQTERLRAAVLPHWIRFWSEPVTAEQFAAAVMGVLHEALTPE